MYLLDRNKLEPFDILLIRFADDETSLKIRETCNSNFSHAIIYLGNGSFIEGVEPTVTLFSYHRYFFKNLDDVKVLRLDEANKPRLDPSKTEDAIRSLAYNNYSKRLLYYMNKRNIDARVIRNFFANKKWQDGVVCTSLVTLPYYVGGVDISNKNEPFYAHFGDIENYDGFIDVTDEVFRLAESDELNDDTYDYFTTYETGTLLEKESAIAKELNLYVENKYRDIMRNPQNYNDISIVKDELAFSSWEDIFPNIMRWYLSNTGKVIDNELSELIISTGYNLLWFEEVHTHKEQFFPFYYHPFTKLSKDDMLFLKNSLQVTYDRLQVNENNVFHNFTLCPCKTFHVLLDMYRSFSDLLRSTITQYDGLIAMA